MKKIISNIIIFIIAVAGIMLLLFPHASFWLEKRNQTYVIQTYDDALAKQDPQTIAQAWNSAAQYNQDLACVSLADPFGNAQQADTQYSSLLNLEGMGIMGHIKIPKISIDLPVYHGVSDAVLQKGIGHLQGTALPVGGEGTHCVLTGHTGLNSAKMFTDLAELQEGDEFFLYTLQEVLAYRVDNITIVEPANTQGLLPVKGKEYVTLVTCTPYGINSHRLLVRGQRTGYTPAEIQKRIEDTQPALSKETLLLLAGIGALVFIVLLAVLVNHMVQKAQKRKLRQQRMRKK